MAVAAWSTVNTPGNEPGAVSSFAPMMAVATYCGQTTDTWMPRSP